MGKPLLLSRKLEEEHWLVGKLGGECVSGFSEQHMVKTLALGTPIPLPGGRPGTPVLPLSVTYQLPGGGSKFRWTLVE